MLLENSLYTNQAEKDELLKDRQKIADALLYNYFGFISLFAAIPRKDVKQWKNNELKVRLDNITDDNTDVSLSVKLAYEAKMLPKSTVDKLTRLLSLFKQGKILKAKDINDDLIHDLFVLCRFDSVNKPSPKIMPVVRDYIDREINIAYLARDLYRFSRSDKVLKAVSTEFRDMFRNSGYVQVYSAFENGHTKLESGVPQKYIKTITDKTIIHQVKKVVDGSSVGITANPTTTGVDQVIDAVQTIVDKQPVQAPVVKVNDKPTSTQNSQGGINFSGVTADSRDTTTNLSQVGQSVSYSAIDLNVSKSLDAIAQSTPSEPEEDENVLGVVQPTPEPEVPTVKEPVTTAFEPEPVKDDNEAKNKEIANQIEKELNHEKEFNPYQDESDFKLENIDIGLKGFDEDTKYNYSHYTEKYIEPAYHQGIYDELASHGVDLGKYLTSVDAFIQGYKDILLSKGLVGGNVLTTMAYYYGFIDKYIKEKNIEYPEFVKPYEESYFSSYYKKPNGEFTKVYQALVFISLAYSLEDANLYTFALGHIYDPKSKKTGFAKTDFKTFFTGGVKGAKATIELIKKHAPKVNFNTTLAKLTERGVSSQELFDYYKLMFSIFDVLIGEEGAYKMPDSLGFIGDIIYYWNEDQKTSVEKSELIIRPETVEYFCNNRLGLLERKDVIIREGSRGLNVNLFNAVKYRNHLDAIEDYLHGYFDYFTQFYYFLSKCYYNFKDQLFETIIHNNELTDDDIYECVSGAYLNTLSNKSIFSTMLLYMANKPVVDEIKAMSDADYYRAINRVIKALFASIIRHNYNYTSGDFELLKVISEPRYDKEVVGEEIHNKIVENIYEYERLGNVAVFEKTSKGSLIRNGDIYKVNSARLTTDLFEGVISYYKLDDSDIIQHTGTLGYFYAIYEKLRYMNRMHNNIYDVSMFVEQEQKMIKKYIDEFPQKPAHEHYELMKKLNQVNIPFRFVEAVTKELQKIPEINQVARSIAFDKAVYSINQESALQYFIDNPTMVKAIKDDVVADFAFGVIKVRDRRIRISNKENVEKFLDLYMQTNYSDKLPVTLDFIENDPDADKFIKVLKYCSNEFVEKNVDVKAFVDYSNNVEIDDIKTNVVDIIDHDEKDRIKNIDTIKVVAVLNLCIKNPSLFKENGFYKKIFEVDNAIDVGDADHKLNDFIEYFDEARDDMAKNVFDQFNLHEIYELDETSKSYILRGKAKEEYEEIVQENLSEVSKILLNSQFDLHSTEISDFGLANVAKINGIGINSIHKNLDQKYNNKEEFLNYLNQKLREDFKNDIESSEAMPITDIKIPEDGEGEENFLIEESIELYKTSNGKHGDVAPLVNKVYNINMDRSKLDAFIEKDKLNPKSESKGKTRRMMFHGTGSIAVAFISKFGFREIPQGIGIQTAGKMLGAGIYLAENVDKSLSYIGDSGFKKSYKSGYLFEVEVCFGEYNVDFVDDRGHDNLRSPEWCIRDFASQIVVHKIYHLNSVPISYYKSQVNKKK